MSKLRAQNFRGEGDYVVIEKATRKHRAYKKDGSFDSKKTADNFMKAFKKKYTVPSEPTKGT